jgi:conjugal transfer/entry exclusion protein
MKKILSVVLLSAFVCGFATGQDQAPPKRPENIGVSDFDTFKNNSFDILDESTNLKNDATRIDKEVKNLGGVLTSLSVERLKQDYKSLKGINDSSQALKEKIGSLDDQGKQLLESAKSVKPMTKSPAATSNTNKSLKGLENSRKNLDATAGLVTENMKLIVNELKSRGESVEE